MSGHSKWHSIKHKKAAADAKRGKIFTKIIKEITVSARLGGGDPETNPRLRLAIQNAKASNMPNDNIQRAVQKGTGELPGIEIEEITYEGYGPGGVALFIEVMTDNKNRTVAEIRHLLAKHNGNLGSSNSVAWKFDRKGMITVNAESVDEDTLMTVVLDAGAEDMVREEDEFKVTTDPQELEIVRKALESNSIDVESSEIIMIPNATINVEGKDAEQLLKILEKLDEHDDVQNVYSDFEMSDELMEKLASS